MTKQINILLTLCLLNGTLMYGWFRFKTHDRNLQQQLSTFSTVRDELSKAEKCLRDCTFPWENNPRFADPQARFEEFFKNALQSNFIWSPKSTPFPLRSGIVRHTGEVTAFCFYPHLRPFLEMLAENDAPLWIRSLQITRNGLSNTCFKVSLDVDVAERDETSSVKTLSPHE